jgi:hypothetical protein
MPEGIANRPVADLSKMLLVDWIYGYLCGAAAIHRRGKQNGCRVIRPVELESCTVRSCKVVKSDLGVSDEIVSCPRPGSRT